MTQNLGASQDCTCGHDRGGCDYDPASARAAPRDSNSVAGLIESYLYWRHHAEQLWRACHYAGVALTFHRVGGRADCPEGQASLDFLGARHDEAEGRYREAEWRLIEIVREACGRSMVVDLNSGESLLWPEPPCTVTAAGYILTVQLRDDGGEGEFLLAVAPKAEVVALDDEDEEEPEAPPAPQRHPGHTMLLAAADHLRDELDELVRLKGGDAEDRADERYVAALERFHTMLRDNRLAGVVHRGILLGDRGQDAFDDLKLDLDMLASVSMDLVINLDA